MRRSRAAQAFMIILVMSIMFGQSGCSTTATLDDQLRTHIGPAIGIRVLSIQSDPTVRTPFMHYRSGPGLQDRLSGAGTQAWQGTKDGASLARIFAGTGGCHGKGCMVQLSLMLATAVTGATLGATLGTVSGALAGEVPLDSDIARVVKELGLPQSLQEHMYQEAIDNDRYLFSKLPVTSEASLNTVQTVSSEVKTVLELVLLRVAFVGTANNGPHELSLVVRTRLINSNPFQIVHENVVEYHSEGHQFSEWQENDAALLARSLDQGLHDIAGKIRIYLRLAPRSRG